MAAIPQPSRLLGDILPYLEENDLSPCRLVSKGWNRQVIFLKDPRIPYRIHNDQEEGFEAVYGNLFLRMIKLTPKNTKDWQHYASSNSCQSLDMFDIVYEIDHRPKPHTDISRGYESGACLKTGFASEAEYIQFMQDVAAAKKKVGKLRNNQYVTKLEVILQNIHYGSRHMCTFHQANRQDYIVYATKRREFSIPDGGKLFPDGDRPTYVRHKKLYGEGGVVMSLGANFVGRYANQHDNYYETRGIAYDAETVISGDFVQHSGLAMVLLGFPATVAARYFPHKEEALVRPLGSIQCILQKDLLPGEGYYIDHEGSTHDIREITTLPGADEGPMNHIPINALVRVYLERQGL